MTNNYVECGVTLPLRLYKLLNKEKCQNGFQYNTDGEINVDPIPFNPTGECKPGGLYYFNEIQLINFVNFITNPFWICRVEIPDNAQVHNEEGKSKADRLILHDCQVFEPNNMEKYINFDDLFIAKETVLLNPYALRFMKVQPYEVCLAAVTGDYHSLQYVSIQSYRLCKNILKRHGVALKYIKEQTFKLCLIAVRQNGMALMYVKEKTPELCFEAVKETGYALMFINDQPHKLCMMAIKKNPFMLKFVKEKTPELCLEAVRQNGNTLMYVKEQTPELCLEAVRQTSSAWQYVQEQYNRNYVKSQYKTFAL